MYKQQQNGYTMRVDIFFRAVQSMFFDHCKNQFV